MTSDIGKGKRMVEKKEKKSKREGYSEGIKGYKRPLQDDENEGP